MLFRSLRPATDFTDWEGRKGSKAWVIKSSAPYQRVLVGVVSTEPNDVIGQAFTPSDNPQPIAISGRVPIKVTNENGPIHAGDSITSSSTPGYGMKATKAGMIVGVALEDLNGASGKIIMRMNPGYYYGEVLALGSVNNYYNPDGTLNSSLNGQILTAEQVDQMITQKVNGSANGVVLGSTSNPYVSIKQSVNTTSWTMTLPTDAGQNGDILTTDGNGNTSWVNRSSITAPLRQEVFDVIGTATDSAQQSTIFGRLAKIETQDIADINTKLSVFTVFTDPVTLLKSLVFNVQTTFEQGITVLQDIVLAGRIKHTDQDTAGIAVIKSGDRQVHITFDRPYVTAPIINITSQGQKAEGYVKDVTENGFTVSVDASTSADLRFSWSAVLIQNPRVSESTSSAVMTPTPTP